MSTIIQARILYSGRKLILKTHIKNFEILVSPKISDSQVLWIKIFSIIEILSFIDIMEEITISDFLSVIFLPNLKHQACNQNVLEPEMAVL